jgi:Fibronectin type III domain
MSEPATETRPAPGGKGGKKYAGLTRTQWYITGGVFAAVLGYLLWKRHQAAAAAAAGAATGGAANQGSNECTDANGNPVDCNQAFASELAGLQNSLDQLGAASGAGGGGSTDTGTVGTTPPDTVTGAPAMAAVPSGTPTTSTGGTTTATKTAGAISNLSATTTTTTAKVSWNPAANASQGYSWRVEQLNGGGIKTGTTKATSVTVSGLHPGWTYNFGIQGLPGGPGNNIHFVMKGG